MAERQLRSFVGRSMAGHWRTTATVTGGASAGTRVRSWGCLFSFPLTPVVNEDFFHVSEGRAPAAPVLSPDEVFSMREKPAVNAVDARCLVVVRCPPMSLPPPLPSLLPPLPLRLPPARYHTPTHSARGMATTCRWRFQRCRNASRGHVEGFGR